MLSTSTNEIFWFYNYNKGNSSILLCCCHVQRDTNLPPSVVASFSGVLDLLRLQLGRWVCWMIEQLKLFIIYCDVLDLHSKWHYLLPLRSRYDISLLSLVALIYRQEMFTYLFQNSMPRLAWWNEIVWMCNGDDGILFNLNNTCFSFNIDDTVPAK